MDAIESGIVKLPRVPVADNLPGGDMPIYRELWKHIGSKMPKKGRGKSGELNPLDLPNENRGSIPLGSANHIRQFGVWSRPNVQHSANIDSCLKAGQSALRSCRCVVPATGNRRPAGLRHGLRGTVHQPIR